MKQDNPVGEVLTKIKDTTANPAPLGLLGFGLTTVLLNIHNAGFSVKYHDSGDGYLLWGNSNHCRYHGVEKGNTFGATAFTSYGLSGSLW